LVFEKRRGSLTKQPRLKGYLLFWAVGSGSDGSGAFRFGRSDLNGGNGRFDLVRTVRSRKTRPEAGKSPEIGFRGSTSSELVEINASGSNRMGLGSVVISVTRVIHLRHLRASGLLGVARAAVEAGLRGGARRCVRVRAVLGTGVVANGRVRVRSAQAR
jgi:hypothetical protein